MSAKVNRVNNYYLLFFNTYGEGKKERYSLRIFDQRGNSANALFPFKEKKEKAENKAPRRSLFSFRSAFLIFQFAVSQQPLESTIFHAVF
jgi:hypothetical protein